jgi:U3 small nucleolar RNA-associated protein 25
LLIFIGENREYRDQGFTKPKVLVLLPFKSAALRFVSALVKLSGATQQDNKKRFMEEFDDPENEPDPAKPGMFLNR